MSRAEILACCCRSDDLAVIRRAVGAKGPALKVLDSPMELTRQVVTRRPAAVVLGIGSRTRERADVIRTIDAIRKELPVIIIADDDSLQLERHVRQAPIFYYLVHPVQKREVEALLKDAVRLSKASPRRKKP